MKRRTHKPLVDNTNKRVKSVKYVMESQRELLQETESKFCSEFGVTLDVWNEFVAFCSRFMVYKRTLNDSFHVCVKQSLHEHNIQLTYVGNANRSKIKQSHCPRKIDEDMWIEIFILMDGIGGYKVYRLLTTEFHFVMTSLFSTCNSWMKHNSSVIQSETIIPSVLLRGCLRYFPKTIIISKLFPDIKPFLIDELQPHLHEVIDIFKMVQLYGDQMNNVLVRSGSEQQIDEYDTCSDGDSVDVVSTAYAQSGATEVLSSLSSLYSSKSTCVGGVDRTIPEKQKLFSRYFYMELPMERVRRGDNEEMIHPYDLGLYAFIEAKKQQSGSIYENYKKIVTLLKSADERTQDKVIEQLNKLKEYIFGKSDFNLAHIIMSEKIVSIPKTSLDFTRLFYTLEKLEDKSNMIFYRSNTMVLDVVLALKYLNVKYRRIFQLDVFNSIHWDNDVIRITLNNDQYKTLTDSIIIFESFMARSDYCVPLYPLLAQRYLNGTPAEAEQCVKIILKMIRETRFSTRESSRWVSNANDDEIEYLKLLPKIIARYNSYSFLWSRLIRPYSNRMGMKFGPSERWAHKQSSNESNAMKFTEKQKYGKNKVNWGLSGFSGEMGGIYIGLESFFATRTRHIINHYSLKRLCTYLEDEIWFYESYPKLATALELIMDGTFIPDIIFYGDQDLVELPFTVDGEKFTKIINNNNKKYELWDCVHVQLFKLCADSRFSMSLAIEIFENLIMRNNVLTQVDGNKKSIAMNNFSFLLPQMTTVRDMVTDELKTNNCFQSDYNLDIDEEDETLERPNEVDFFVFLLESLERLSFYHTDVTRVKQSPETESIEEVTVETIQQQEGEEEENMEESEKEEIVSFISPENIDYRGSQKKMPRSHLRWLPFNNRLVSEQEHFNLPIFYDKITFKPVYSNSFIPTMWTISHKYTGSRKLIRKSLRQTSDITSFMLSDPDLINCLVCYPPNQL